MPGTYTGEFVVWRAAAAGTHVKRDGTTRWVSAAQKVYLHPGDRLVTDDGLTLTYPNNGPEGRPYLVPEFKKA